MSAQRVRRSVWLGVLWALGGAATASAQQAGAVLASEPDDSPAWHTLRTAVEAADVVFVGEWHGFADTSEVVAALLASTEWRAYAVEVGPWAAEVAAGTLARSGVEGWARRLRTAPMSVPFLWWREDAEVAHAFLASAPGRRLIGFDREFPWSARLLLDPGGVDPRAADGVEAWPLAAVADSLKALDREAHAGYARFSSTGEPGALLLYGPVAERLERLATSAEAASTPDGRCLAERLRFLARSARLDAALRRGAPNAGAERTDLMARTLAPELHAEGGRVLLRTGLDHAARGTSWKGRPDLPATLAAEGLGHLRTVHVAVVPAEGTVNAWMPGAPDEARRRPFDGVRALSGLLDLAPFVERAAPEGWTLYDMRSEAPAAGAGPVGSTIGPFDFLVIVRRARAATLLN